MMNTTLANVILIPTPETWIDANNIYVWVASLNALKQCSCLVADMVPSILRKGYPFDSSAI